MVAAVLVRESDRALGLGHLGRDDTVQTFHARGDAAHVLDLARAALRPRVALAVEFALGAGAALLGCGCDWRRRGRRLLAKRLRWPAGR